MLPLSQRPAGPVNCFRFQKSNIYTHIYIWWFDGGLWTHHIYSPFNPRTKLSQEVVGFYAFQFGPPNGVAEDLRMSRGKLEKMVNESKLTMCGAIMPSNAFKKTWEIVPGNE